MSELRIGVTVAYGGKSADRQVGQPQVVVTDVDIGNTEAGGRSMGAVAIVDLQPVPQNSKMKLIDDAGAEYLGEVCCDRPGRSAAGPPLAPVWRY